MVWCLRGVSMVLHLYGSWFGIGLVWCWYGIAMVLIWYRHGTRMQVVQYGNGIVLVWYWCGVDMVLLWCWYCIGIASV